MEDKKYYENELKQAEQEKEIYLLALKNHYYMFENEDKDEKMLFCAKKISKLDEMIEYYNKIIKEGQKNEM